MVVAKINFKCDVFYSFKMDNLLNYQSNLKCKAMATKTEYNYVKSSNLIFLTVGLVTLYYLITFLLDSETNSISLTLLNVLFIGGVGLVIRKGYKWAKFMALALFVLYALEVVMSVTIMDKYLFEVMFLMVQIVLVSWATLLLFLRFHH